MQQQGTRSPFSLYKGVISHKCCQTPSINGAPINVLGFVDQKVSVETVLLCHYLSIDNTETTGCAVFL